MVRVANRCVAAFDKPKGGSNSPLAVDSALYRGRLKLKWDALSFPLSKDSDNPDFFCIGMFGLVFLAAV